MISGTIYGVVLNDRSERTELAEAFEAPPYKAPPQAPVLYIKPRGCLASDGAVVRLDPDLEIVEAAATIGLLFDKDVSRCAPADALAHVSAACLALDVTEPHASYYRPVVRQRCRDGFLPLGQLAPFKPELLHGEIVTLVNGQEAHRWSPKALVLDPAALISEISAFMTLAAGDLLLIGLPFQAPRVRAGDTISVRAEGLSALNASFARETTS